MRDPKKILIGIAIGNGSTRWETSMSLIRMIFSRLPGYEFEVIPGGGCDVCHARNLMFHHWRTRSTAGILLFIDSDVIFGPEHIDLIVRRMTDHPDILYLGGLYPLKGMALRWSYGGWSKISTKHPELWEVFELCTGFTALRFELLERLIAAHPDTEYRIEDYAYRGETGYEICAMGPVKREWSPGEFYSRRMPEDFYLSLRARELGVPIYVDPTIQLGHIGSFNFLDLHEPGKKEITHGHF